MDNLDAMEAASGNSPCWAASTGMAMRAYYELGISVSHSICHLELAEKNAVCVHRDDTRYSYATSYKMSIATRYKETRYEYAVSTTSHMPIHDKKQTEDTEYVILRSVPGLFTPCVQRALTLCFCIPIALLLLLLCVLVVYRFYQFKCIIY